MDTTTGAKRHVVKTVLPYNYIPRPYQEGMYMNIGYGRKFKRGCCVWHRRSGKDKTLINLIVREAFTRVGTYHYIFPFYSQGRKVIWDGMDERGFKFLDHIPKQVRKHVNKQEMKIELKPKAAGENGSVIQIVGSDNIDSVVGTNPVGVVYSEMALQNPEAWDFFRPILAQNGGWAIFNSTPRGANFFYELFQRARSQPERWYCELLTVDDTKAITEEAIQNERDDGMSEELIEQEYYCRWDAEQAQQLIPWALVNEALNRNLSPQEYEFSPVLMGVDVALGGDDLSVICVRQGVQVHEFSSFSKYDPSQLTGEVINKINRWKPSKIFIDMAGGYGAGVYYNLRDLGYGHLIYPVNGGKTADDKSQFVDKRAEMWWRCRLWIQGGGALPKMKNKDLLNVKTDLASQIYEHNNKRQIVLWSKAKMKKEKFSSPDHGDALCFTFAFEIPLIYDPDSQRSVISGYNYGNMYGMEDVNDPLVGW